MRLFIVGSRRENMKQVMAGDRIEEKTDTGSVPVNERSLLTFFEKIKSWSWVIARATLLIGLSFVILYPIILKLSIAFKDKADLYDTTVMYIPRNITLENFKLVIETMDFFKVLWNSFVLSGRDRKSTRLNSSHVAISYAVFCLKKKK